MPDQGGPRSLISELDRARRAAALRVVLGVAIALLDAVAYVLLLSGYGSQGAQTRTLFVVAFLVAVSGVGLIGAAMAAFDHRSAGPLLWAASSGLAGLGLVGIASIGLPLLLAAALTVWSTLRWPATPVSVVAAAVPLILLAVGLVLT
jgi:hypothetical protein